VKTRRHMPDVKRPIVGDTSRVEMCHVGGDRPLSQASTVTTADQRHSRGSPSEWTDERGPPGDTWSGPDWPGSVARALRSRAIDISPLPWSDEYRLRVR
jgi:hypothetical protein